MAGFISNLFKNFSDRATARREARRAARTDFVSPVLGGVDGADLDALMARRLTELEGAMAQLARAQLDERREREQLVTEIETLRRPVEPGRPAPDAPALTKE